MPPSWIFAGKLWNSTVGSPLWDTTTREYPILPHREHHIRTITRLMSVRASNEQQLKWPLTVPWKVQIFDSIHCIPPFLWQSKPLPCIPPFLWQSKPLPILTSQNIFICLLYLHYLLFVSFFLLLILLKYWSFDVKQQSINLLCI